MMDPFCRLCLKEDLNYDFLSFLSNVNDEMTVAECYKIITCLLFKNSEIEINKSKICQECLLELKAFDGYRNKLLENNLKIDKLRHECEFFVFILKIQHKTFFFS